MKHVQSVLQLDLFMSAIDLNKFMINVSFSYQWQAGSLIFCKYIDSPSENSPITWHGPLGIQALHSKVKLFESKISVVILL